MKSISRLLVLFVLLFLIGCGGGDTPSEDTQNDSEESGVYIRYTPEIFEATDNAYNFNSDKTALLTIEQLILNQWENPFPQDSFILANRAKKVELYNSYIVSAINEPENILPIYAPQGDAGDFIVTVNNNVIDFTNYQVPADIDGDGLVTLEEDAKLLIDALVDELTASMYDVNNDGDVDNRDLLYLVARLLTQADSFHFYTTDGQELGVSPQFWGDTHVVNLSSLDVIPNQIRIIVRDINGASSVKDMESITKGEWYMDDSITRSLKTRSVTPSCTIDESILTNLFPEAESEYIIGFQGSIKHVMGHKINGEIISQGDLSGCFNLIGLKYYNSAVHKYFVPYNMNQASRWAGDNITFAVQDGFRYGKDLLKNLPAWNKYSKDIATEVHATNYSEKKYNKIGNKIVYTYSMVHTKSVYHESAEKYPLEGKIVRDNRDTYEDCGKLIFDRIGPADQKYVKASEELTQDGSDASYLFNNNLAMGHHTSEIWWEGGGMYQLSDNYMFIKDETNHDFEIPYYEGTVTGKVLDANDEPVEGAKVSLISVCQGGPARKYSTSKADGSYEFTEVYIGAYNIELDNKVKAVVTQKGTPITKDLKTDSLWEFHVKFQGSYGIGSMSVKKFPIDIDGFDNLSDVVWVGNDYGSYKEGTTISYSGLWYDNGLSPLVISHINGNHYIDWSAMQTIDAGGTPYNFQVGSMWHGYAGVSSTTHCAAELSPEFKIKVELEEEITWTSGGQGAICTFTFKPCKNSECTEEDSTDEDSFDDFDDEFNNDSGDDSSDLTPGGGLGDTSS